MKKNIRIAAAFVLALIFVLCLASCTEKNEEAADLWDSATYTENTTLGLGPVVAKVEVVAQDKTVTFEIRTKESILGDALLENGLIAGDEGDYGLYIKEVNGITADYDTDGSYWAFYVDGEMSMTGVDTTEITEGSVYRLEYTK